MKRDFVTTLRSVLTNDSLYVQSNPLTLQRP